MRTAGWEPAELSSGDVSRIYSPAERSTDGRKRVPAEAWASDIAALSI